MATNTEGVAPEVRRPAFKYSGERWRRKETKKSPSLMECSWLILSIYWDGEFLVLLATDVHYVSKKAKTLMVLTYCKPILPPSKCSTSQISDHNV